MSQSQKIKNIVFSGGGLKGLAYIGALRALEEYGIIDEITSFAGSSAGAIAATMFSLGYTHSELYDFIRNFEYQHVRDIQLFGVIENFGLETGLKIERFLQIMIKRKTGKMELTFAEHYELTKKKLSITAVSLNDKQLEYFNVDTSPEMPVYLAVRMSMSIPILISPVRWKNKLYVDGGLLNNVPIDLFKDQAENTLVFMTEKSEQNGAEQPINDFETYCYRVWDCMHSELTAMKLREHKLEMFNVVKIKTDQSAISFNLTRADRKMLYKAGYRHTTLVLKRVKNSLFTSIVEETDTMKA